jgi:hypothetical protein
MTALSAPSATGTASIASPNSPSATAFPNAIRVRIAGSDRTYEVRDVLRGMGLRWDPQSHAWHGSLPATARSQIERDLGLPVQLVQALDSFPAASDPPVSTPTPMVGQQAPRPRTRDGSRSRLEARVAIPREEEAPGPLPGRFSLAEVTSGLPDDSREADERAAERSLYDFRGRVKEARALVASTPGVAETLARGGQKAAAFYARFGITETQFRKGVPADSVDGAGATLSELSSPTDGMLELRAREAAALDLGSRMENSPLLPARTPSGRGTLSSADPQEAQVDLSFAPTERPHIPGAAGSAPAVHSARTGQSCAARPRGRSCDTPGPSSSPQE